MPHQALALHRVHAHTYDLSALRTGSLRDQLLRSTLLAEGLLASSAASPAELGPQRPLLVIGAGAAGMNLAMHAASQGNVPVVVVEREAVPFATLRLANWRPIDPVAYDWPHLHHHSGVFPAQAGRTALRVGARTGAELARDMQSQWRHWQRHHNGQGGCGRVELHLNLDASVLLKGMQAATSGGLIHVPGPWPAGTAGLQDFGAVVSCAGFGTERTHALPGTPQALSWNGHVGPRFWLDDDRVPEALPGGGHRPWAARRVLVSGGGDGAMQDLQRALTGLFGLGLLQRLHQEIKAASLALRLDEASVLLDLALAEDRGRRAVVWSTHGSAGQELLRWHQAFEAAVLRWCAGAGSAAMGQLGRAVLRPEVLRGTCQIDWVYPHAAPGQAYALNRFLLLLLQRLLQAASANAHFKAWPGHRVGAIRPPAGIGHRCGLPGACVGLPHHADIETSKGQPAHTVVDADFIVVRHGIDARPLFKGVPISDQMVAYDLPD